MSGIDVATVTERALDWIVGNDCGVSSTAIWAHMMGRKPRVFCGVAYPLDPDDFGRCHRLLALIPEWRPRITEMAKYGREWAGLSARWADVEASYEREVGDRRHGMARETYDLMKAIESASRHA